MVKMSNKGGTASKTIILRYCSALILFVQDLDDLVYIPYWKEFDITVLFAFQRPMFFSKDLKSCLEYNRHTDQH